MEAEAIKVEAVAELMTTGSSGKAIEARKSEIREKVRGVSPSLEDGGMPGESLMPYEPDSGVDICVPRSPGVPMDFFTVMDGFR